MTSFQIESTADAFFVRFVQALPDGGFAALLAGVGAAPAQLAVFGFAPDGSAHRVDADIILANQAVSMVERNGGGFAVLAQITGSSPDSGRTHATLFDASGNETDAFILPATIFLGNSDPQPNFSAIPGSPDLWLKGFDEAGFFLSRVDSETLRPLDPPVLLRTDAPSFILDGGFGLVAPFSFSETRGELIEATSFTTEDGLVPVYANPRNVDFSSSVKTAAGNSVVEVGITRQNQSIAEGGNILGSMQINLIEPDSGAIRTLTNDFLGFGFVEARVVEVPGLGFAVLVVIEGGPRGTSGIIDAAEVLFFDFDGNERGSAVISDLVGQRTTSVGGTFTNLVDPLHQNLRFLTIWSPTDESGNSLAARGTITTLAPTPFAERVGFLQEGTAYGDYLTGLAIGDVISGGDGADTLHGNGGGDVLVGDNGIDFLDGGDGDDFLRGGAGSDILFGAEGNDSLSGGDDDDRLIGSSGDDTLDGGEGDDNLGGGLGADFMLGGAGSDTLSGGGGNDLLRGGLGNDTLEGDDDNDTLNGGEDDDHVDGGDGNDSIIGEDGHDSLLGGDGNDSIQGGGGNDLLNGGDGTDNLVGDDGDDTIIGGDSESDLRDVIFAGAGNDSVDGGHGNDLIFGMGGNDTIAGGAGADDLRGQDGDDVITGSAFSDIIFGNAGNDFLNGGFGSDRINGGTGADKFFHVGVAGHGSDWVQDYNAAEGDVLLFGIASATRDDFLVQFNHTANDEGERSGDDTIAEAFVTFRPTGQIMWALVDGEGQSSINLQIGSEVFDLLA